MIRICKKCLLTDEIKEITFDKEGICCFCRTWERIEKQRLEEKKNLPKVLEELKKGFIIGLSGGVDSSYCLHLLAQEGLKPKITFSMDNNWNNPIANENIKKIVMALKIPFENLKIDIPKFKELQEAFIKSGVPNIEIPTDHILLAITYQQASKYNVKYIVSGGNHANEDIMPESWSYWSGDLKQIKAIYKKFTGKRLEGLPTCGLLKWNYYKWIKGIKIINLLDYYEYNQEKAKKILFEKYGWEDYGNKHEENYYTQWFQNCYLPIKFGIDKRRAHLSSLINSKQITKRKAMEKLTEPIKFKLIIKPEEFMKYLKKSHYEYPNNEKIWKLLCKMVSYARRIRRYC